MIDWTIVRDMLPAFWNGLLMTLLLLVSSAVAGLALAVPLAVARSARSRWARRGSSAGCRSSCTATFPVRST